MSADSPRRLSRKGSTGHVVLPQPVSDPSIIDSVAGFIHEVIPQAYSSVLPGDSRESIAWARFEQADCNDPSLYPDAGEDCDSTPPLLLVLGYSNGVQVWSIASSGEAVEVLSWNQRVVRTLRFLPSPLPPSSSSSHSQSSPHHPHSASCDPFAHKRPLIALVDNSGPPPHFSTCSFISLHAGDQVKSIKFKNPICDVLANRRSIVITFVERIAVFDALTLEDRLTVTTCYPSPGVCPNPVALGSRWLAFADKRLVSWWRSVGGCDLDGAHGSYTASVLHAAKTLGKGLRGLSGQVASHLAGGGGGGSATSGGGSPPTAATINGGDAHCTPGVVTVVDIEGNSSTSSSSGWSNGGGGGGGGLTASALGENIVAHFVAHLEPIVALAFDPSGMLLLTVDKRGHRFHLFRIQPHLSGASMSEVHQLYTLYRGDTTARIQDVTFSCDSRWVAVSSLRGTTHVFPITPYGGSIGVRTHTTPHVVNKLSRFHRSAGLSADGGGCGRNSPVAHDANSSAGGGPPLTPPLSHRGAAGSMSQTHAAVTVQPLAQLRRHYPPQQTSAGGGSGAANSDSDAAQVRVAACFAPARAALPPGLLLSHVTATQGGHSGVTSVGGGGAGGGGGVVTSSAKPARRKADSIYVMSAPSGALLQYDLEPRHVAGLSKERVSDDTAIELLVDAKAEWLLMSPPLFNPVQPPLTSANPLLLRPATATLDLRHTPSVVQSSKAIPHQLDEHWLSQVEIVTHAGPHRRLWMGPQFTFKTYSLSSSDLDKDSVEVGTIPVQSNPINVPMRPPLLIESGSTSSLEQSPHLTEVYQNEFEFSLDHGESRLREDLADAMQESPSMPGRRWSVVECGGVGGGRGGGGGGQGHHQGQRRSTVVERRVNPLGTIIMVQQPPPPPRAPHQLATPRQSTEHLIVVAAESKSDVTRKNSVVSSNRVGESGGCEKVGEKMAVGKSTSNNNKERRKNAKNDRKSTNVEKSINDKSINVEKSSINSVDKSMNVDESINSVDNLKNVEKSIDIDRPISAVKSKNSEKSIDVDKSKSVEKSIKVKSKNSLMMDIDKSTSVERSIDVVRSTNVEKSMDVVRSTRAVETSKNVDTSIEVSTNVDESMAEDRSITIDSIESSGAVKFDDVEEELCSEKLPPEQITDCNVGSGRASKRRAKNNNAKKIAVDDGEEKKEDNFKENEGNDDRVVVVVENEEVEVVVAETGNEEEFSSVVIDVISDKTPTPPPPSARVDSEITKDREYPALMSSVKTKRKCRTLGKRISKAAVVVGDDNNKPSSPKQQQQQQQQQQPPPDDVGVDLLEECHHHDNHNLMDFPDLLLANVKVVDNDNRPPQQSIAKVVIETIEKDNMIKKEEVVEEVVVEKEVARRRDSSDEKEETTDKDSSSDDCCVLSSSTSSKCDVVVKGGGGGGGGGGASGKKKKNRKKEVCGGDGGGGGGGHSDSDVSSPPLGVENVVEEEPVVKLSWSQIASKGRVGVEGSVKKSVEGEDDEEEEEVMIEPEIISWNKAEKDSNKVGSTTNNNNNNNSTEDRGSVYESCCESVEDAGEHAQCPTQCLIEVADEVIVPDASASVVVVAAADECHMCQSTSEEKESASGDSAGKESADSGEKETLQTAAKKSRKQRKKRR